MEKDGQTRIFFLQYGTHGAEETQAAEAYPKDNSGDKTAYVDAGPVQRRADIYLRSVIKNRQRIWTAERPGHNKLPKGIAEEDVIGMTSINLVKKDRKNLVEAVTRITGKKGFTIIIP